jgi:hypothetical protein
MKTGKITVIVLLGLFLSFRGMAQGHNEPVFPDRTDPVKAVQMFPNPATDYLTLKLESPHARKVKVTLFTIIGSSQEVETEILDDFELRLKVKDLASGYYLLAIHDYETNFKNTYKFLKR